MKQYDFGGTGRRISRIGQGTWYLDEANHDAAVETLRRGLDAGMTHIDTAEMYGDAELVIADALVDRRDEGFLVSKVLPSNASYKGTIIACERSLARLQTDRLDCYLLHWRGGHPLAETFRAFETLIQSGKILSWGVSNFDVPDLEEAIAVAGPGKIACNQVLYHLEERAIEHAVLPWCETNGVTIVAYSPFGHDRFPSAATPGGKVLREIGALAGVTPRQVALAALTRNPAVVAIPKASSAAHAEDNAKAGDLELSAGDLARIDSAFPRGPRKRHLPML